MAVPEAAMIQQPMTPKSALAFDKERMEVFREFMRWTEEIGNTRRSDRRFKAMVLARLLGIVSDDVPGIEVMDEIADVPFDSENAGLDDEPPPPRLTGNIVRLAELRLGPAKHWSKHGEKTFVLPSWLLIEKEGWEDCPENTLWIHHCLSPVPSLARSDDWNEADLKLIRLSPRTPEGWRRSLIELGALAIFCDLQLVLGAPPTRIGWLQDMITDPQAVESEAIGLWDEFRRAAELVPQGLRIPGFESSIADLLVVYEGRAGGKDRRWFADHWPVAQSWLLKSDNAQEVFNRIDENQAAAVPEVTRLLCCVGNAECEEAKLLARAIPKYRHDENICRMLAFGPGGESENICHLLRDINLDDKGELLRQIARQSTHAREQMAFACAVATEPVFESPKCQLAAAKLVARALAGSGIAPDELDAPVIARGLVSVSADCLAAIVSQRIADPSYELSWDDEIGSLDAGIMAFTEFVSQANWHLTRKQLMRFLDYAHDAAIHRMEMSESEFDDHWPAPVTWNEKDRNLEGAIVEPLRSVDAIRKEGEQMQNCLRGNLYDRTALLGRVVLFSIRGKNARATLSLKSFERNDVSRGASSLHT